MNVLLIAVMCSSHYPTTKFTAVVDTPESLRLAQNTKIQSQVRLVISFIIILINYSSKCSVLNNL